MERAAQHRDGSRGDANGGARARAERRWGLDRLELVHGEPADDDHTEDLARVLLRALRHRPVFLLHDRRVEDGSIIDHLAIGPGGLTVIAVARDVQPPLGVERIAGVFGARAERLHDAVDDQTARVLQVREQVFILRRMTGDAISVKGAICPRAEGLEQLHPLDVGGVLVANPTTVAALARRDEDSIDLDITALVDRLDRALEPVFGRPR
jgi:hypothetical protein